MRTIIRLLLATCLPWSAPSLRAEGQFFLPPDPLPKARLERIELAAGRPFDCLVVKTVPGISCLIEASGSPISAWDRRSSSR